MTSRVKILSGPVTPYEQEELFTDDEWDAEVLFEYLQKVTKGTLRPKYNKGVPDSATYSSAHPYETVADNPQAWTLAAPRIQKELGLSIADAKQKLGNLPE